MNMISKIASVVIAMSMVTVAVSAEARPKRAKVSGPSGTATTVSGERGSSARVRGGKRNDDGSVTVGSAGVVTDKQGAGGGRASTTTVNPDGSFNRRSASAASGAAGQASSTSDVTRNADGTFSGGRSSQVHSNSTGTTYNGSTQIDPATGKPVRSATCTNAAGEAIACPTPR